MGLLALIISAAPAQASWVRVETDKFIVYGEGGERSARDFATKLTTFDTVLRRLHPATLDRKPKTKVQVFLVNGRDKLRRVRPGIDPMTAGVYLAMNEGVFAIAAKDESVGADDVMFHEYAHHFMYENFPAAYPAWFVEGWAEYFMTTEITASQITVGGFNPGRAYSIFQETWVPLDELLSKTTGETRPSRRNVYYSEAWLLMHYMRSDETRAKQLNAATLAIAKGQDPVGAMQAATGMTMAQLTDALEKYRRLPTLRLRSDIPPPQMTVTPLPASADDLLLDNLRLILSDTGDLDADFLAGVRRKAARYPGDRLAERTLARAEFVMGDVAAGEAIMTRRLGATPDDTEDLLLAGTGQVLAGLRDPATRDARYRAARPLLAKAYQLDKGDFRPLYAYELSRSIEPRYPTDNDLAVLLEARALAPSVQEISFRAGVALLQKGRREEARALLTPLINNPHGGEAAAKARELLNQGGVGQVDITPPGEDAGAPSGTPTGPAAKSY